MAELKEAAEQAIEAVESQLEGLEDAVEHTVEIVRNNPIVVGAAFGVGLLVGGLGGYFVARKRLSSFYEDLATQEIAEAKVFYSTVYKVDEDGEPMSPQDVMAERHGAEAAAEALRDYQGVERDEQDEKLLAKAETRIMEKAKLHSISLDTEPGPGGGRVEKVTEVTETINVFDDGGFNLEAEQEARSEDAPYILHHDEYFAGEKDYDMSKLTYFEMDGVLVDEHDKPIDDSDTWVGDAHLARFGHGSNDKNIVYVRNDRLQMDFEIVRSNGSYLEEVLGMVDEPDSLKHSDQRDRRRAFRHGDG